MIVRRDWAEPGVTFVTEDDEAMQLGLMCHPKGHVIRPHFHQPVERSLQNTQEVLFIRKGELRVDFYHAQHAVIDSRTLHAGDAILLLRGGHGFEATEDLEMIEAKTGPFVGERDKIRFDPPSKEPKGE